MNQIAALDPNTVTGTAKNLLDAVGKSLGVVPNLFRVTANSPAALEGMVALNVANHKGKLDAKTREAIALATAEANGCDYCLSAHTFLGKRAGLGAEDIEAARDGRGTDPRIAAAARFARVLVERRGHPASEEITAFRAAGYGDAEVLEVIAAVAWNVFTNYVNEVAGTEIDFDPIVRRRAR